MKKIISLFTALVSLGFFIGCENMDDNDRRNAGIGAASGAAIGGVVGNQSDSTAEGAAIGAAAGAIAGANYDEIRDQFGGSDGDFESLSDYDTVLTRDERALLRDRAIEAGDDPDDYLEYLTSEERDRLRDRAEELENS